MGSDSAVSLQPPAILRTWGLNAGKFHVIAQVAGLYRSCYSILSSSSEERAIVLICPFGHRNECLAYSNRETFVTQIVDGLMGVLDQIMKDSNNLLCL